MDVKLLPLLSLSYPKKSDYNIMFNVDFWKILYLNARAKNATHISYPQYSLKNTYKFNDRKMIL